MRRLAQFERAGRCFNGRFALPCRHICLGQIGLRFEQGWIERDRARHVRNGLAVLALPHQHGAKPAVRLCVARKNIENLSVSALGFDDRAGLMLRDRSGEKLGERSGRRGRSGRAEWRHRATTGGSPFLAIHMLRSKTSRMGCYYHP